MEKSWYSNVEDVANLKEMLIQSEKMFGSKNAFYLKVEEDKYEGITFTRFKNDVDALGTALIEMGLKDTFIAVIGENRYEWCTTYLSVVNGVGVIVPLDRELPVSDIEYLLNTSKSSAIVFSGKVTDNIKAVMNLVPTVKYFINMDAEEDTEEFLSYKRLINKGYESIQNGSEEYINAPIENENMSILLFTSGTTGLAKGVMLSHKNICANLNSISDAIYLNDNDSIVSILPLHHTYECTTGFLAMIHHGVTISFNEGLKYIAKNLQEYKPTLLILVPLILENMYKKVWDQASKNKGMKAKLKFALKLSSFLKKSFKVDIRKKLFKQVHNNLGGNIRLIISGAAGIDPEVSKGLENMGFTILQGYGLTECAPLVSVNRFENYRHNSIGLPVKGVEIKIESADANGIGEIVAKGDNVMLGYFENKEATDKVLKNGWIYTGDLGYKDKEGFYYITGRSKNVIVTKNGKNIFPEEVESYLNKSPYILESLVFEGDKKSEETEVNAQIVPNLDAIKEKLKIENPSQDEIYKIIKNEVKIANKHMPLYKQVKDFAVREKEFEKTTTKKIKRYKELANK